MWLHTCIYIIYICSWDPLPCHCPKAYYLITKRICLHPSLIALSSINLLKLGYIESWRTIPNNLYVDPWLLFTYPPFELPDPHKYWNLSWGFTFDLNKGPTRYQMFYLYMWLIILPSSYQRDFKSCSNLWFVPPYNHKQCTPSMFIY